MINFLFKRQQNKVQNNIEELNQENLVFNYKKILEFISIKMPKMRWQDNYLDEDIWANNVSEIDKLHKALKRFYIDYPLSTYKMKLYCDKKCKYLFEDLYNSKHLSQDKKPIDCVKCSCISNGKKQYKKIKLASCKFTLKQD